MSPVSLTSTLPRDICIDTRNRTKYSGICPLCLTNRLYRSIETWSRTKNKSISGSRFSVNLSQYSSELLLHFSTWGGTRTRTGISAHWILSPACLPIPPPRQVILFWADEGTRTPVGLFVSGLQNQCCRHWATSAYNGGKSKEWFYWRTWTFKSLFLRQMCIPFHEVTLLITIHYFVVLVGNDPTTSSMSQKRSPIELQNNIWQ